ncbi:ABC transporter permease [Priestia endophytica]|uniref:ABC transporter permease n=1 Tax=Priestia endophytica TaxID=135735 RepID=UPI000DCA713B|nr:ABC transporter permease [Priestia endophytica]RAS87545.1 hypothetical protein A4U60_05630 [Priestia endophytica]
MIPLMRAELLKLKRTKIWLLLLISPLIILTDGLTFPDDLKVESGKITLMHLYQSGAASHTILLFPLLIGIFAAFLCRHEHLNGGWKQLLVQPVRKGNVFLAKLLFIVMICALIQLFFLGSILLASAINGGSVIPEDYMLKGVLSGFIASVPLATLQIWASSLWASFGASLALNVIFTVPNILIVNSETYGPFYPWVQPALAMISEDANNIYSLSISTETLIFVIGGSFLVFFICGFFSFKRKAY